MNEYCVILVTCPDRASGMKIGGALVEEKLAACANLVEGMTSIYRWKHAIHRDAEVLLIIKTRQGRFADVEKRVLALHPYEAPEIIACDITAGNASYLKWIEENT
ncbi:MAG TPA: divalent-cation tolerance protein CutA [Gammaproteobacteria bacterium]